MMTRSLQRSNEENGNGLDRIYLFFFIVFILRGLFERLPLNDLDNDRYLHADIIHFCCCSNSAYPTTANSTFLLHLENLSVAVYLMCVYARCSIARLFLTYLLYCTEDEESFNSFLPRTFYLKMVVVHIA